MGFQIESGGVNSHQAIVSSDGRLTTDAVTSTTLASHSTDGRAFYMASTFIPLSTTGSFSGIFTIKNTNAEAALRISSIRTCGTVQQFWELYGNASTGTLFDNGTVITPNNINLASGTTFIGEAKYGADALTITDGIFLAQWINNPGHTLTNLDGSIILKNGNSLSFQCKPAAAGDVCVTVLGFFE